jgi:hypothetical protein
MEAKPIRLRRTKNIDRALALVEEKWPGVEGDTDKLQRVAEQWLLQQDAGTSKTQKLADIDARLAGIDVQLAQITDSTLTVVERVTKLGELFDKLYPVIVEMKEQLAQHGFKE